jgi:hypothetical protein
VSIIHCDVLFLDHNIHLTRVQHGIAAAVKQTAAPPHPTSPDAVDGVRAAGNTKGMVKKVSLLIEIGHFYY